MDVIRNRLAKNLKNLKPWATRLKLEAFRLYERDIPDYPFLVDLYKDHVVVYNRSNVELDSKEEKKDHLPQLLNALQEILQITPEKIVLKNRERQKGLSQYDKLSSTGLTFFIQEGPAKFKVNLYDYLDTGLFLDHRIMREKIMKLAAQKKVLNLFCYTGSVSVFAALGGGRVTSVDMSSTYIDWAKENFQANNLSLREHDFIVENALAYLEREKGLASFDMIFCDPPTFSNSKKMFNDFEVERDQDFLIESCMSLLKPGGVLFFSNNKRGFKLSEKMMSQFEIQDISSHTIPKDFRDQKIHKVFEIRNRSSI